MSTPSKESKQNSKNGDEGGEDSTTTTTTMEFAMDSSAPMTPGDPRGSSNLDSGLPFFADAQLDLDEAHDIAETPEPQKLVMGHTNVKAASQIVAFPSLDESKQSETEPRSGLTAIGENSAPYAASTTTKTPRAPMEIQQPNTNNNVQSRAAIPTSSDQPENVTSLGRIDGGARQPIPSSTYRPKPPRRPRDIPWLVGFCLFVPLVVFICSVLTTSRKHASPVATSKVCKHTIVYSIVIAMIAAVVLLRLLYRTLGGGDGDDARHKASQVLLAFAPISLGVHALLIMALYLRTPAAAFGWSLLPLWSLGRDVFAMQRWRTTASTAGGRQAFFSAIFNTALDILSRSLRRASFYRVILGVLGVQFLMILFWRSALLGALRRGSTFWLFLALLAGKWATGTVARMLGLIASGGVTSWFVHQSVMMEEMQQKQNENHDGGKEEEEEVTPEVGNTNMFEEYRMVDASAYQPVLDLDDGIDDDFEDEEEVNTRAFWSENSTVMSFLKTGLTVSFGSVAQCGLLGGLAQFVWSVVRNLDNIATLISQRFPVGGARLGFRGMQIGTEVEGMVGVLYKLLGKANVIARGFVRNHSDLAMCQVAAYYKGYQRAAQDVAILVDSSGVEPIIHDDITTHICACVCGSISGTIVLLMGFYLDHHRRADHLTDPTVVKTMVIAFVLCYSLIFTVLEPLRASIKAIYVCFAQFPHSLSQAYPLIFSRLTRISEANIFV